MQNSRSQPNLYSGGTIPSHPSAIAETSFGLSQGHIANFNRSSIELSSSRSPFPPVDQMADSNRNYGDDDESQRWAQ